MDGYEVTDSQQFRTMTKAGNTRVFYRVHITTDNGATGDIEVAEKDWKEDKLKDILSSFAEKLDLAFSLSEE